MGVHQGDKMAVTVVYTQALKEALAQQSSAKSLVTDAISESLAKVTDDMMVGLMGPQSAVVPVSVFQNKTGDLNYNFEVTKPKLIDPLTLIKSELEDLQGLPFDPEKIKAMLSKKLTDLMYGDPTAGTATVQLQNYETSAAGQLEYLRTKVKHLESVISGFETAIASFMNKQSVQYQHLVGVVQGQMVERLQKVEAVVEHQQYQMAVPGVDQKIKQLEDTVHALTLRFESMYERLFQSGK
jgi:hypothetical protein